MGDTKHDIEVRCPGCGMYMGLFSRSGMTRAQAMAELRALNVHCAFCDPWVKAQRLAAS